jgi:hypothetical protein
MSRGAVKVSDTKEQMFVELEQLLKRQIAAARIDDLSTVKKLADECDTMVMTVGSTSIDHNHKQKLQQLYRQMECILADKRAMTEQQLQHIQKSKKLFGSYRP